MKPTKKILIKREIKCPKCGQYLEIRHTKELLKKSEKAEYKDEIEVSKSEQMRLAGSITAKKSKGVK